MLDLAARRALEFPVGEGVLPEPELRADAVGHPAAAEIFIERSLFQTARKHLRGASFRRRPLRRGSFRPQRLQPAANP